MTTCGSAKNNRVSISPHGGIAFPKNNSGRDVMIDSPSEISGAQLKELSIKTDVATGK